MSGAPGFLGGEMNVPSGATGNSAISAGDVDKNYVSKAAPKHPEGTNKPMGIATLVGGTVTVSNNKITATSRIFLTNNNPGGTPGFLRVSARVVGTSFTITSSSGTDTSDIAYLIMEPDA